MYKKIFVLVVVCHSLTCLASESKLSITGTMIQADPVMSLTSTTWNIGSKKVGEESASSLTSDILIKAPNQTMIDNGSSISLAVSSSNTNWRGIGMITVEESNLGISALKVPLGGSVTLPVTIKPTLTGITFSPIFKISGKPTLIGTLNESLTITATYV